MSLSDQDSRALAAIERQLSASEPRLTAMLATFTRLTRDEQMPSREQLPAGRTWLLTAVVVALITMVTVLASFSGAQWASKAPRTVYGTVLQLPRSITGFLIARPAMSTLGR